MGALSATIGWAATAAMLIPNLAPQPAPQSDRQSRPQSRPKAAPQSPPRSAPESRAPRRPSDHRSYDHRPSIHHRHFIAPAPIIVPSFGPPAVYYSPAPYFAPPPVYYAPAPYAEPPTVYVERSDGYWYYCAELAAYYPDVAQCPGPWQPVPAR